MPALYYKFKSELLISILEFDGLYISIGDIKTQIAKYRSTGAHNILKVTNMETNKVYEDDMELISKNQRLTIMRIPGEKKVKGGDRHQNFNRHLKSTVKVPYLAEVVDLSSVDAPEDKKIRAMIYQSTNAYHESNYEVVRGANQVGPVPPTYRCRKCQKGGHWCKDCPLDEGVIIKKCSGIPRTMMMEVDGPEVKGAMMTATGTYAIPYGWNSG